MILGGSPSAVWRSDEAKESWLLGATRLTPAVHPRRLCDNLREFCVDAVAVSLPSGAGRVRGQVFQ
jgi:hypothetical protein